MTKVCPEALLAPCWGCFEAFVAWNGLRLGLFYEVIMPVMASKCSMLPKIT